MGQSANSLFHFTNDIDKVIGILKNGFMPAHCWEQFVMQDKVMTLGVPMVSFCDIPISQVKGHLKKYGGFGIGMSIEWGKRNKLNPVFYLDPESRISNELDKIGKFIFSNAEKEGEVETDKTVFTTDIMSSYISLIGSIKNYSGQLTRKNQDIKDYKFYDEREWRYIPDSLIEKVIFNFEDYERKRGADKEKPLLTNEPLKFCANDIKYILVNDDSDIPTILSHLKQNKNLDSSAFEIELLGTRIITSRQINEDF